LGALNKQTGEYTCPKLANKKDAYICPDCRKDLILCQGEIRVHHFRHVSDDKMPCNYYNKPSEGQIHKDAKMLLKQLLDNKIPIIFVRPCISCKENDEYIIPEITESSSIQIEHRFNYNNSPKIADLAYLDHNEIICIFEIYNTHKTSIENRPEPWFEIDANKLINTVNDTTVLNVRINCIRPVKCDTCIDIEQKKKKKDKLTKLKEELYDLTHSQELKKPDDVFSPDFRYSNAKQCLLSQIRLIENDISFTLANNIYSLEHPLTGTKVKHSLVKEKTFYNGKWHNNIRLPMLVNWFRCSTIENAKSFEHMLSLRV
jgi:hypothetical protein